MIAVFLDANTSSTWALLITWSFSRIYSLPPLFLLPPWNARHNFPYLSSLNDCGSASEVARTLRKDCKVICHPPDLSLSLAMCWFSGLLTRMDFMKAGPMCSLSWGFCICNLSLHRVFCPPYRASFENALPFTCQHPLLRTDIIVLEEASSLPSLFLSYNASLDWLVCFNWVCVLHHSNLHKYWLFSLFSTVSSATGSSMCNGYFFKQSIIGQWSGPG